MKIDGKLSEFVEIEKALPALSERVGRRVARSTASAWIREGYIPGVRIAGGKTILIPKKAIELFVRPNAGRYASRANLARGIGIALECVNEVVVPLKEGVLHTKCPRCGGPWVTNGNIPVMGHEKDLCCCNLACLYIGPDFIRGMNDERAALNADGTGYVFRR